MKLKENSSASVQYIILKVCVMRPRSLMEVRAGSLLSTSSSDRGCRVEYHLTRGMPFRISEVFIDVLL